MNDRITINPTVFPKGKAILRISVSRKPKGIIERVKSLFGKKFIREELMQSYYRRGGTIFVKRSSL